MIEFSREHEIDLELYSTTRYFAERVTWSTDAHSRFFGIDPNIMDFAGFWKRERVIKAALVITNAQEEAKAMAFSEHFADRLNFSHIKVPTFPDVTFVNILSPGTSKGRALEALALKLGVSLSEVVAVGDGKNDISLLSAAGLGIAMGNAHKDVKKVADHVPPCTSMSTASRQRSKSFYYRSHV